MFLSIDISKFYFEDFITTIYPLLSSALPKYSKKVSRDQKMWNKRRAAKWSSSISLFLIKT